MDLEKEYGKSFCDLVNEIKTGKEAAVPSIISRILFKITPQMMKETGRVRGLPGEKKKELIVTAIKNLISLAFKGLELIPVGSEGGVGGEVKDLEILVELLIDELVPKLIDTLILVDNGHLKFNKRACCSHF